MSRASDGVRFAVYLPPCNQSSLPGVAVDWINSHASEWVLCSRPVHVGDRLVKAGGTLDVTEIEFTEGRMFVRGRSTWGWRDRLEICPGSAGPEGLWCHQDGTRIDVPVVPSVEITKLDGGLGIGPKPTKIAYPVINGVRCANCPETIQDSAPSGSVVCPACAEKAAQPSGAATRAVMDIATKEADAALRRIVDRWMPVPGPRAHLREVIEQNIPPSTTVEDACRALLNESIDGAVAANTEARAFANFCIDPAIVAFVERVGDFRLTTSLTRETVLRYEGRAIQVETRVVKDDEARRKAALRKAWERNEFRRRDYWMAWAIGDMAGQLAAMGGGQ